MEGLEVLGIACMVIGWLTILWKAFSDGILWGIGSLLVPLVGLLFVFTHWHEAKTGFLLHAVGWIIFILASAAAA